MTYSFHPYNKQPQEEDTVIPSFSREGSRTQSQRPPSHRADGTVSKPDSGAPRRGHPLIYTPSQEEAKGNVLEFEPSMSHPI